MPFPKTKAELEAAGYKYEGATRCQSCHIRIDFWTTPAGKHIPLNEDFSAHFSTCPDANKFRKKT